MKNIHLLPTEEQKQHLIDIMRGDEELGLYEEAKKETIEEAAFDSSIDYKPFEDNLEPKKYYQYGFEKGAKWQQEQDKNKYSEEEVLAVLQDYCWYRIKEELDRLADEDTNTLTYIEWFQQFKKKK
jgi:hypothetical protein